MKKPMVINPESFRKTWKIISSFRKILEIKKIIHENIITSGTS